ncbi:hypothetical protein D9M68_881090 [compost metagenome]
MKTVRFFAPSRAARWPSTASMAASGSTPVHTAAQSANCLGSPPATSFSAASAASDASGRLDARTISTMCCSRSMPLGGWVRNSLRMSGAILSQSQSPTLLRS